MVPIEELKTTQDCPKCGKTVPVHSGFVTWCECGWNQVRPKREAETPWEKLYQELGKTRAGILSQEIVHQKSNAPGWNLSTLLLFLVSLAIHLFTLLVLGSGIWLVFGGSGNVFLVFIGLVLLGLAYLLRPRFTKRPKGILDPNQFPKLHREVASIAQAMLAPNPQAIAIDFEWNAHVGYHGVRQEKILTLGLPLISVLEPRQRVALIAHELGHFINKDPARGTLVALTIETLTTWYRLLYRDRFWQANDLPEELAPNLIEMIAGFFSNILLWLLSFVPYGLLQLVAHLHWDTSQRAEYFADRAAAKLSGHEAFVEMLLKLSMFDKFFMTVQKVIARKDKSNLFLGLIQQMQEIPPRELERIRRTLKLSESSLDSTHPPTDLRIQVLEERQPEPPTYVSLLTTAELNQELEPLQVQMNLELRDAYRNALYS